MNLPELEEQLSMFTTTWIDWRNSHEKYGESCYAKGRADLLKEIGEPVAWLDENGFPKHINNLRLIAEVWKPLYVIPKGKS